MFDLQAFKDNREAKRTAGEEWFISASDALAAYQAGERDLSGANLHGANLYKANLSGADLRETCLDPDAPMLPLPDDFPFMPDSDGFFVAYRTKTSRYVGNTIYEADKEYTAPYFSVDTNTECHPGLYFTTLDRLDTTEYAGFPRIVVRVHITDVVCAGDKFRCKKFFVVQDM